MKKLLLATFAILAASSSLFKCEAKAFFFLPLRFEYNQDKTNDHAVKTLAYSSPLTGKRYNVDYRANWNYQPPPTFKPITLTIPHPASIISMFKPFNFHSNWNYNHGQAAMKPDTSYVPPPESTTQRQQLHTFNKQFNWDLNWNFNHGSSLGAASHEKEEAPVSTTTTTTTTSKPVSDSVTSNGLHGEKRIQLEWSLNLNHGKSGNNAPSTKLQPPSKASSNFKPNADDDFDDGFEDDESKNDANNESTR